MIFPIPLLFSFAPSTSHQLPRNLGMASRAVNGKGKGGGRGGGKDDGVAPKQMAAGGTSKSWTYARANNISVANDFLKHIADTDQSLSDRWGGSWVDVPEEEAASREIFARLATYLAEVHLIKPGNRGAGKNYDSSTADACWSDLMRGNEQRFSKSKEQSTMVRRLPCAPAPGACCTRSARAWLSLRPMLHAPCSTLHA